MYPPEALNQYMSSHGQTQSHGQTPPPPAGSIIQQQHQQQATPGWPQYPVSQAQMPMYPYPYAPHMHASASQTPVAGGQYQATNHHWAASSGQATYPGSVQTQAQIHVTPPPYSTPSSSSTGLLNISSSFAGPYGAAQLQADQNYNFRNSMPPRRGMNRAYGPNNRHPNARASPNRLNRLASNGQVEASYSFVDTIPQSRSHQYVAVRTSGSYPASLGMHSSLSGM